MFTAMSEIEVTAQEVSHGSGLPYIADAAVRLATSLPEHPGVMSAAFQVTLLDDRARVEYVLDPEADGRESGAHDVMLAPDSVIASGEFHLGGGLHVQPLDGGWVKVRWEAALHEEDAVRREVQMTFPPAIWAAAVQFVRDGTPE